MFDALIEATLDQQIEAIECIRTVPFRGAPVNVDGIVFHSKGQRHFIDFPDASTPRDIDEAALALLAVDKLGLPIVPIYAADVMQEPRFTNSQTVWNCRHAHVSAVDRARVLALLCHEGSIELRRAAAECLYSQAPVSAIFAMACADLLEVDLREHPLSLEMQVVPRTPVRADRDVLPVRSPESGM